jgi:DNA (cytosine-5)-methyltransferase 1
LKNILYALGTPNQDLERKVFDPNYPTLSMLSRNITDHHYIHGLAQYQWEKAKRLKLDKGYMGRMAFPEDIEKPARTVMATMTFGARESMIFGYDRDKYRAPTIREVACLMSFPIDYQFYGDSVGIKYTQVGNSVPPKLAYAFATTIAQLENLSLQNNNYTQITRQVDLDFVDLNFTLFDISKEKPKPPNSRFKYHIPYLIIKSFRVELTNHHSDFLNKKYRWDVEIHRSQGPNAKIYTPKIQHHVFTQIELELINRFCEEITCKDYSHLHFQQVYCMTAEDRSQNNLVGPHELLEEAKKFILDNCVAEEIFGEIPISDIPYLVPKPIVMGYYILGVIINNMDRGGK